MACKLAPKVDGRILVATDEVCIKGMFQVILASVNGSDLDFGIIFDKYLSL